jgi:hypothetical protein
LIQIDPPEGFWNCEMLRVDIITIFPEYFREAFDYGIIRRGERRS